MGRSLASQRFAQPQGVMVRQLDDESILLDLETGHYYGLDDVGTRLYEILVTSPSLEAAHAQALEEFEVTAEVLQADLSALASRLVEEGLLEEHDVTATP